MNFYKAKYLKNNVPAGRSYTFKSPDELLPGDAAETPDGKHVQVVDEPVDIAWVADFGESKIKAISKSAEEV